jgi:hypothetical protein
MVRLQETGKTNEKGAGLLIPSAVLIAFRKRKTTQAKVLCPSDRRRARGALPAGGGEFGP